jgi:hypothetical protein
MWSRDAGNLPLAGRLWRGDEARRRFVFCNRKMVGKFPVALWCEDFWKFILGSTSSIVASRLAAELHGCGAATPSLVAS